MKFLFVDYETLSDYPVDCVVTNAAWLTVDTSAFLLDPYDFDQLVSEARSHKFLVKEQLDLGWKVKKDTVNWWKEQDKETRKQIIPSDLDLPLQDFKDCFEQYMKDTEPERWFTRGNNFDGVITERIFHHFDSKIPMHYSSIRDVRTYLDTRYDFAKMDMSFNPIEDEEKRKTVKAHNCVHDIALDIIRMQKIEQVVNGYE